MLRFKKDLEKTGVFYFEDFFNCFPELNTKYCLMFFNKIQDISTLDIFLDIAKSGNLINPSAYFTIDTLDWKSNLFREYFYSVADNLYYLKNRYKIKECYLKRKIDKLQLKFEGD